MVLELLQEQQGLLLMLQGPLCLLRHGGRQPVQQQHPSGQAVCVVGEAWCNFCDRTFEAEAASLRVA